MFVGWGHFFCLSVCLSLFINFFLKGDAGFSLCWWGRSQSHWWQSPVSNGHALVGCSLVFPIDHNIHIVLLVGFFTIGFFPPLTFTYYLKGTQPWKIRHVTESIELDRPETSPSTGSSPQRAMNAFFIVKYDLFK